MLPSLVISKDLTSIPFEDIKDTLYTEFKALL